MMRRHEMRDRWAEFFNEFGIAHTVTPHPAPAPPQQGPRTGWARTIVDGVSTRHAGTNSNGTRW